MGVKSDLVRRLLSAVDTSDPDEYVSFFTDDAEYKIGNTEPVIGKQGILNLSSTVMQTVKSVSHDIQNIWELGDTVICHVTVIYNSKDGKIFKIPSISIIRFTNDKIQKYQAFIDASPVFS